MLTSDQKERIAIVNAFRFPLKVGTAFKDINADELGIYPLKETFLPSNVNPEEIDEVVVGCCGQPAHAAMLGELFHCELVSRSRFRHYCSSQLCIRYGGNF